MRVRLVFTILFCLGLPVFLTFLFSTAYQDKTIHLKLDSEVSLTDQDLLGSDWRLIFADFIQLPTGLRRYDIHFRISNYASQQNCAFPGPIKIVVNGQEEELPFPYGKESILNYSDNIKGFTFKGVSVIHPVNCEIKGNLIEAYPQMNKFALFLTFIFLVIFFIIVFNSIVTVYRFIREGI